MARRSRQLQELAELLKLHEPRIAKAFAEAILDARRGIDVQEVINALARGDVEGALRWLEIGRGFMAPLDQAQTAIYLDGGRIATATVQGLAHRAGVTRAEIRFDGRNPRAETWLREASSRMVTAINEDTRTGVREVLRAGMEAGRNPRTTALDIVGRVNRATGNREGGLIGLTGGVDPNTGRLTGQMGYVENARAELASGDPVRMRGYLKRVRRDKRFDRTVLKAIREGKPVPDADAIARRYADRLLKLRGDTIARTESLQAFAEAQEEAVRQAIESGRLSEAAVKRTWRHSGLGGEDARVMHIAMSGETRRFGEPFVMGDGVAMMFPHDPAGGAEHNANCRCWGELTVDHFARFRQQSG